MARQVPVGWIALIKMIFGGSQSFAVKLWLHLYPSPTLLYQLGQVDQLSVAREVWIARMQRLSDLLTPAMLIQASLRVSPEGQRRDPESIRFENAVLSGVKADGSWLW